MAHEFEISRSLDRISDNTYRIAAALERIADNTDNSTVEYEEDWSC